jgi:Domain of unknown function (DUF4129)
MKRLLAAALLLFTTAAVADTIPLDAYIASLEEIRALLAAKEIARAQDKARALAAHDVAAPQGTFHADTALLERVASTQRDVLQLQEQLTTTIDELRRASASDTTRADPNLLRRVAEDQRVPELAAGGNVPVHAETPPLFEQIAQSIGGAFQWIGNKIAKIFEWILDLFPSRRDGLLGATGGMRWIVTALVAVIVLLIVLLAFEVTRRSRAAAKRVVETSEPIGSKRDEDPLSRGANEWERYAAQLAAAGKFREAIRAWYHAVLVTCYAAGVLHYRKSRTNWEYVAALGPSVPWRGEMIRLTQRFEREWYGADQSSQDALDDCAQRARTIIDSIRIAGRGAA